MSEQTIKGRAFALINREVDRIDAESKERPMLDADRRWLLDLYKEFRNEETQVFDPFASVPPKVLKELIDKGYLKDRQTDTPNGGALSSDESQDQKESVVDK